MQTARNNYVPTIANHIERALSRMPDKSTELPSSLHEISRYVEQLLTPAEQAAYDMATD